MLCYAYKNIKVENHTMPIVECCKIDLFLLFMAA